MNAEDGEEVAGNGGSVQANRFDGASDGGDEGVVFGDGEQRLVLRANVFKIWVGKIHAVAGRALLPQVDDPIGLRIGQRAKEHTVDHAEDSSGCADADGQREDGRDGERWSLEENPQSETEILQKRIDKRQPAGVAMSFLGLLWAAKAKVGLALGLLLRHPALQIVFDRELKMRSYLGVEITVERRTTEKTLHPRKQSAELSEHGPPPYS